MLMLDFITPKGYTLCDDPLFESLCVKIGWGSDLQSCLRKKVCISK